MSSAKQFVAPVWILGFMLMLRFLRITATIITARRVSSVDLKPGTYFFVLHLLVIALLIAQIIAYWLIRKKIKLKNYAWLHMALYIVAFVLVPVVNISLSSFITNRQQLRFSYSALTYLYWICFASGIILLVHVVKDVFTRQLPQEDPEQSNDILTNL